MLFVVSVCPRHVIWDDALTASSYGYIEREDDYIRLCGHVLVTSVSEPRDTVAGRDIM